MEEKGYMVILGSCYEDIVAILSRNGYTVTVETEPSDMKGFNYCSDAIHKISYCVKEVEF